MKTLAGILSLVVVGVWLTWAAAGSILARRTATAASANTADVQTVVAAQSTAAADDAIEPARNIVAVLLRFAMADGQPTNWDGRLRVSGARVARLRPWRFGAKMTVDAQAGSWRCGSWFGPEQRQRTFDGHLPNRPRPFVRPGVLVELEGPSAGSATLDVTTPQGDFVVRVAALLSGGSETFLDGGAAAVLAVAGEPVAVSPQFEAARRDDAAWHDHPSIAVSPQDSDDVWVCYQTYSQQEGGDRVMVRRRLHGKWLAAQPLSPAGRDVYRTALAYDGQGQLWAVTSLQTDDNWELVGRAYSGGSWGRGVRLSHDDQPDMHHRLIRAVDGSLWLVWQGFRGGQSDVLARRWDGAKWGPELKVSESTANDWQPSAAPHPDGGIAVAWDSYEQGNYDVFCRRVTMDDGRVGMGPILRVTGSSALQARASVACDAQGRMWIAYDTAGAAWGKDTGFWLELKPELQQGTRLYEGRGIGLSVVESTSGGRLMASSQEVILPLETTLNDQLEQPRLVTDDDGRLWMFFRRRVMLDLSRRGIGRSFRWEGFVSAFEPASRSWSTPRLIADSAGRIAMNADVAVSGDRLWAAWATDHRGMLGAAPDNASVFAGFVLTASLAPADLAGTQLSPAPQFPKPVPDPAHPHEKQDIARIRGYAIRSGEKTYHIYRGDMHRHTETSSDGGGDGDLLDAYRYAIDAAGMDFLLVTDHHDGSREYDWWRREKSNDLFRVGTSFVGLFGYERSLSYPNGHRNVFLAKRGTRPLANLAAERRRGDRAVENSGNVLYPYLRINGGICFSHTSATGMGTDWRDNNPDLEPLVEIFQGDRTNYERLGGPWSADPDDIGTQEGGFRPLGYVHHALAKKYKLGFQASSDHLSTHLSYSCILAEENTRASLMDAMKRRHAYAATDNIVMDVRSRGIDGPKVMGDAFTSASSPTIEVRVLGTNRLAEVVLIKDNETVYTHEPDGPEARFSYTDTNATPGEESFYYVRAVQVDERIAWASPMWITPRQ